MGAFLLGVAPLRLRTFRVKLGMKNDFYTYAYLREDGTPYYIGKGRGKRAFVRGDRRVFPPSNSDRILFLKTNLTEQEAFQHEIYMIAVLGRKDLGTGILWNFTDGGDGVSGLVQSEEAKEKMRVSKTGQNLSENHKQKIRESLNKSPAYKEAKYRPVLGTRPDGEVFYFDSITEATKTTGVENIGRCCRGGTPKAGGWTWTYFE